MMYNPEGTTVEQAPLCGRAWVVNGEFYFSPNSSTFPGIPEHNALVRFHPGVSKAIHYQEPRWWNSLTEWLGFVPKLPVPYAGPWFEALNAIPNHLIKVPSKGYMLASSLSASWNLAEDILSDTAHILKNICASTYLSPFPPCAWRYSEAHASFEIAMVHIEAGRDWFSMWIGLVYWLMKKTPEAPSFIPDVCPPRWFIEIVRASPNEQARWDTIRRAPIMQSKWIWNRVGIWLRNPADAPDQPTAQWFVDQGVPVWYKWDRSDFVSLPSNLIEPSPEHLQQATTWIMSRPSMLIEADSSDTESRREDAWSTYSDTFLDKSRCDKPNRTLNQHGATPPSSLECTLSGHETAITDSPNPMERTQKDVLHLLSGHFGFVPPLPYPSSFDGTMSGSSVDSARKLLITVLGLEPKAFATEFIQSSLGKTCVSFLRMFSRKESNKQPDPDLWDLSEENRQTLMFSERLNAIRIIKSMENKNEWYMFDFADSRTVPWNLAVSTAEAALYVCRLGKDLKEEDIAIHLAQEGIRFHTLQRRDSLRRASREDLSSVIVPMRLSGHVFDEQDYQLYLAQTAHIMSLRRARAAIMHGGFTRKIALEYLSIIEVARGPQGLHDEEEHMFVMKDLNGVEYVDDNLTTNEFDVLCGLYITFTGLGSQTGKLSWYPLVNTFEGSGDDMGWWTHRAESLWNKRKASILRGHPDKTLKLPLNTVKWRDRLRGYGDGRRAQQRIELLSEQFIKKHVGEL